MEVPEAQSTARSDRARVIFFQNVGSKFPAHHRPLTFNSHMGRLIDGILDNFGQLRAYTDCVSGEKLVTNPHTDTSTIDPGHGS